jgi:MarR family transcriptional regulator, 2-MHQ and catechol-resistance regulon repressor
MASGELERRIGKREPFGTPEEAAVLGLLRTSDRIQAPFTRLFREHGLTPAQYNVLRILRGEGKPTPILEIAERMLTATPGITGLIDRLEKLELVRRERCSNDRRVIYVTLSAKAAELLKGLDEPVRSLHRRLLSPLGREDLETLIRLLDAIREPIEDPDE